MSSQNNYTFTIDRNKRHQVHIEKINVTEDGSVLNDVFFSREYEQAISIVQSIIDIQNSSHDGSYMSCFENRIQCCKKDDLSGKNNIVLFTGQRGSGKTSAVLSFARYLEESNWEKQKFGLLPMIDPSYFDNNCSILKTVLTSMFKVAKCMMNKTINSDGCLNFNNLWKEFEKAFRTLGDIEGKLGDDYSLETLNELGDSSNMKEVFQNLITEFIHVTQTNCLVLVIDDLDMNISYAAKMLEQIRKFMMVDNLIILIAANLEQLQSEMREYYSSSYEHTMNNDNQVLSVDVDDMATKYLLKVFPASRRIHVYNATDHLVNAQLIIKNAAKDSDFSMYEGKGLQSVILTMIWERTRLLFLPKEDCLLHPIIPRNLRDLSQFANFLLDMKKVECDLEQGKLFKNAEEYYLCQKNFTKFKNYIVNNWIPEILSFEDEALFENIPHDVSEINKHLINAINVKGTKNKKHLMSREVDLEQIAKNAEGVNIDRDIYTMVSPNDPKFVKANKISDIFNQPSNYSYGDLLLIIDKYETYFESEEDRRFINAIKIYYSMLLFDTFFFKSTNVKYSMDDMSDIDVDTIIPIQRLLGGTVYYPNYFEIINSEFFKQKGPSYDAKRAFYHKFTYQDEINKIQNHPEDKREDNIYSFKKEQERIVFFILYYGDVRPDRYDQKHTYDTIHYRDASINGVRYATFDILSLFNNALNPIQTILRANDVLKVKGYSYSKDSVSYRIRESLSQKISEWGETCCIDSRHNIPNSILPFYSVDVMLQYLRKSYEDAEIIGRTAEERQNMIRASRYDELLPVLDFDGFVKDQGYRGDHLRNVMKRIGNYVVTPEADEIIANCANVLLNVRIRCKRNESVSVDIAQFKEMVVNLVIDNSWIDDKKRKEIIKQIHSISSKTEIYSYLKEVLWKDVIMEMIIRRKIQEQIRNGVSIYNYYNNLWGLTKKAFGRISIIDTSEDKPEMERVYKAMFDKGSRIFIN